MREIEQQMLRKVASKVAWVGRTASMVFGLALVLALLFGATSMAFAKNGDAWLLGRSNVATALTSLGGKLGVNGAMVRIINNNAGTNDTALDLRVQAGEAPLRVNSTKKVTNLNADKVDNREASSFANATHQHSGEAITSGTVEADRIEDGPGSGLNADQLDGVDSTQFAQKLDSGMITLDPTSIAAQTCGFLVIDPPGAGDISNDVVVVTPDSVAASLNLVFGASRASQNPNAFRIRMCNITAGAIDPPSATYYWMIFHQP